jgi:hypothetical protein
MKSTWLCLVALAAAGAGAMGQGCSTSSNSPPPNYLTREQMLQPEQCASCHQNHFDDWTASMHAKASDDPVFLAMNQRGQRETNGTLGKFCVQCHAPMAVRDGKTTNGLNLASLPTYYKGVTCFFCHTIDSVGTSHDNASVNLSGDLVMRGEISDPVANSAHASTYSSFHDDQQKDSATMCGSCHDIDSPAGGHIERTFAEWSFSGCHMKTLPNLVSIATGGPATRLYHPHDFPAVDVPLESLSSSADGGVATVDDGVAAADGGAPDGGATADSGAAMDATVANDGAVPADGGAPPGDGASSTSDTGAPAMAGGGATDGGLAAATASVQNALDNDALQGALCVTVNSSIRVILDTAGVGHHWPSGAAQDRRAWAEVIAYGADGSVIYSSGVVPDGTPVTSIKDPDLWLLRDCMYNAQSQPVDNFWQAAQTGGYELPALLTFDAGDPNFYVNHIVQSYPSQTAASPSLPSRPSKVTLRIRIQPIGLDVLDDLVDSGDLDPSVVAKMPTFDVSLQGPIGPGLAPPGGLVWTPASNDVAYTDNTNLMMGPATCAASPGFRPLFPVQAKTAATCTAPSP